MESVRSGELSSVASISSTEEKERDFWPPSFHGSECQGFLSGFLLQIHIKFSVYFETGSHAVNQGLRFAVEPRMSFLFWSLLFPPPVCWDYRHAPPHTVHVVLGIKPGDSWMLDKHSAFISCYQVLESNVAFKICRCCQRQWGNKELMIPSSQYTVPSNETLKQDDQGIHSAVISLLSEILSQVRRFLF